MNLAIEALHKLSEITKFIHANKKNYSMVLLNVLKFVVSYWDDKKNNFGSELKLFLKSFFI